MMRLGYAASAVGAAALCVITATAGAQNINVTINGERVEFQNVGPQQVNGRILVPLRGVLETMGAVVDWNVDTHTVVASLGNKLIHLPIGSRMARVGNRDVPLDVPAMTTAGTTMVPLRFVSEALGARVNWDGPSQTVQIDTTADHIPQDRAGVDVTPRGQRGFSQARTNGQDPRYQRQRYTQPAR